MFAVYIIYSKKPDKYYIGYSEDLAERLNQHNDGFSKFTSITNDWQMVYNEPLTREREI